MSKVTLNSPVKTLSGKLNRQSNLVFVTRHRTERVSTRTLPSHSSAQKQTRENFAILRRQAQYILATPSLRDPYVRLWAKQRKYHTLLGFIMHSLSSPSIEH